MRVGIYGASGYTGQELMRLLVRHPRVEVTVATSRRFRGTPVSEVYLQLAGFTDLCFIDAGPEEVAERVDFAFLALPHGTSMQFAPAFFASGRKTVDLSADYRLHDLTVYERWYGKHCSAQLLAEAVYGLPELHRAQIRQTRFVANPGCYPQSAILALAPALQERLIDPTTIIIDAKSGVSGAGREPVIASLFCEVNEDFKAYKVGQHRHTPEMEQELGLLAGQEVTISFTPHLVPMNRGILTTAYASLRHRVAAVELTDYYRRFYAGERFVRVCRAGTFPNVASIRGSNYCDIGVTVDERTQRLVAVAVIDNLTKGAAGAAVQNMNVMCGFPEDDGLGMVPFFP